MSTSVLDSDEGHQSASSSDERSSTSDADSTSNSDTEEEITPEYLQSLLDKARRHAREEARRVSMLREEREVDGFGGKDVDIIKIGDGEEEEEEEYV